MNRGDLDLDDRVDVTDAVGVLRIAVQLDAPATDELFRADLDDNGEVNVGDVMLTLSKALGL